MNNLVANSLRFVLFILFQVLVLNNLEIGGGMYPMLYPLFIFMLPFQISTVTLMLIAFFFGCMPQPLCFLPFADRSYSKYSHREMDMKI
jgi:hypothetical protein